jgi:hypothetical protein
MSQGIDFTARLRWLEEARPAVALPRWQSAAPWTIGNTSPERVTGMPIAELAKLTAQALPQS